MTYIDPARVVPIPLHEGSANSTQPPLGEDIWTAVDACQLMTSVDAASTPSELRARFPKGFHARPAVCGIATFVHCWLSKGGRHVDTTFSFDEPDRLTMISSEFDCASKEIAEAALAQASLALRRTVPGLHVHHPKIVNANRRRPASATVSWRFGRHEAITIEARQGSVGARFWTLTLRRTFKQPDALAHCRRSSLDRLFT